MLPLLTLSLVFWLPLQASDPPASPPPSLQPLSTRLLAAPPGEGDKVLAEAIARRAHNDVALIDSLVTALDPAQRPGVRRLLISAIPTRPFDALPPELSVRVTAALISTDLIENAAADEIVRATWPACRDHLLQLIRTRDDWARFAVLFADIEPAASDPQRGLEAAVRPRANGAFDPIAHWALGDTLTPIDDRSRRLCELFRSKATLAKPGRRWRTSHGLSFLLDVQPGPQEIIFTLHIVNISDQPIALPKSIFAFGYGRGRWSIRDSAGNSLQPQRRPGHYVSPARGSFALNPGEHVTRDLTLIVESKPDGSLAIKNHICWIDLSAWPPSVAWSLDSAADRLTEWSGAAYLDVPLE